jgi:hypothetical protein
MAEGTLRFDNLERVLMGYAQQVSQQYRENLEADGKVASGKLSQNITCRIDNNGKVYDVVLVLEDYWKWVEYDTGRRKNSGSVPSLREAILKWIQVKPVIPRPMNGKLPTQEQLAYLIARKIANEGTKGSHALRDAVNLKTEEWEGLIRQALKKDIDRYINDLIMVKKMSL